MGTHERLFTTGVNIPEKVRSEVIDILNIRLADTIDLQLQCKQAHWNVKGAQFFQLHTLFDQIAERVENATDTIAERITALGGVAMGTAREVAKHSGVPEYNLRAVSCEEHLHALSKAMKTVANSARSAIDELLALGDQGSADVFIEIVRSADKDLWFLEAHLQA